jgi:hypothetical protein
MACSARACCAKAEVAATPKPPGISKRQLSIMIVPFSSSARLMPSEAKHRGEPKLAGTPHDAEMRQVDAAMIKNPLSSS